MTTLAHLAVTPDIDFDDMSWRGPMQGNQSGTPKKTREGKLCPSCERFLGWEMYHKSSRQASVTGRQSHCKDCRSIRSASNNFAVSVVEKVCSVCGETKPASDFHKNRRISSGLASNCKWCVRASAAQRSYGLTTPEFLALHEKAQGICGICKQDVGPTNLNVDHHHVTGAVRGLLCARCNTGLYLFDDPTLFLQAYAWANQEV